MKRIVGMADGDTRRHIYDLSLGFPYRLCTENNTNRKPTEHLVQMPNMPCDCKSCLKTLNTKEIWLSEHCSTKDVQRLIADFIKQGRNPSSNLDEFVAFVFERGVENESG